jgi:quinolinate synthase
MLAYAASETPGTEFIVGTDIGLIHRLRKENRDKVFYAATDYLVCPTMKLTTLEDIRWSLENMEHLIALEDAVRAKARLALDRMMAVRVSPSAAAPV